MGRGVFKNAFYKWLHNFQNRDFSYDSFVKGYLPFLFNFLVSVYILY